MRWLRHRLIMMKMALDAVDDMVERNPDKVSGMRNFFWQLDFWWTLYTWYVRWYKFCERSTQFEIYQAKEDLNRLVDDLPMGGEQHG